MHLNLRRQHDLFFLILLVYLVIFFRFFDVMNFGPMGFHQWRQSDSASQTMCYYENGMHFFQTKMHNVLSGDNAAVSEFPIIYYMGAALYHLAGPKEAVLRWLNFLILVTGFYGLSRVVLDLTQNAFSAVLFTGAMLCSPVLIFYGFGFIPNAPPVGLSLLAFWFYWLFLKGHKLRCFYLSAAAITLGGMIKPTVLSVFLAWLAVWLISFIFYEKDSAEIRKYFPATKQTVITFAAVIGLNLAWIVWIKYYNHLHQTGIFINRPNSILNVPPGETEKIWNTLWENFMPRLSLRETFWIFLSCLGLSMLFFKKFSIAFRWFWVFLLLATAAVFFLFFKQLEVHDYYLIDMMPFYFLGFAAVIYIFQKPIRIKWVSWALVPLFFIFMNMNAVATRKHMLRSYGFEGSFEHATFPTDFGKAPELRKYLGELGINYHSTRVMTYPDYSPNITLYMLNLRGWNLTPGQFSTELIQRLIGYGGNHIAIFGKENLENEILKPFLKNQVGAFEDKIFIFKTSGL